MSLDTLNKKQMRQIFLQVAETIVKNEPYLTEIDMKIGDGDHGTGMELGFKAVLDYLSVMEEVPDIDKLFQDIGFTLLDTMGGASGVLFGTVFISGVHGRTPSENYCLKNFAEVFRKSLDAIKQRGRAKVGDKTMVDALEPAVIALEKAVSEGGDIRKGFQMAADAAKVGVEYTKEIKAKFGRAKYYGEKAIGLQDPGATSVWLIFQAMSDWIATNETE